VSDLDDLNFDQLAELMQMYKASIKEGEEKIKAEKAIIKEIDANVQRRFATTGATAVATPHGTLHTVTRTSVRCVDPAATISWLKEKDLWRDAVVLKLNSSWVKSYEEETGEKVPGAEMFVFVTVNVTTPTKKD